VPLRLLTFGVPVHKQVELEKVFQGPKTEMKHAESEDDFGRLFGEFDPTHILVLTKSKEEFVRKIIEKRESPAKVTRFRL